MKLSAKFLLLTNQRAPLRLNITPLCYFSMEKHPQKICNQSKQYDYVGPPHKEANIRLQKFCIPDKETALEKEYRISREEALNYNINFWSSHNASFKKEKACFIKEKLLSKYGNGNKQMESKYLTTEEMAEFYEKFLQKNSQSHLNYNKEWYKRNFRNLYFAFRVFLHQQWRLIYKDNS